MITPRPVAFLVLLLAAVLVEPGVSAADEPSLLGTWRIARYESAPWVKANPALLERALAFKNARLRFLADRVEGPSPFGCQNAHYDAHTVPPQGTFQGNLKDPRQASALGLPRDSIPTVGLRCDTGVFDFHFVDANKAVTALDNIVYVLVREAEDRPGQTRSVKASCPPWFAPAATPKLHALATVTVVNDPPTFKAPPAPATLHPDTEAVEDELLVQTWDLASYRDRPLYLRCTFEGTTISSVEPVPEDAGECRMTVGWNAKRRRVDVRIAPFVLECR